MASDKKIKLAQEGKENEQDIQSSAISEIKYLCKVL